MLRRPVSSSRMVSVGWANNIMEVEFTDGAIYQYYNVSNSEYVSFMSSPSLGHALSILDKNHRYSRVN